MINTMATKNFTVMATDEIDDMFLNQVMIQDIYAQNEDEALGKAKQIVKRDLYYVRGIKKIEGLTFTE